MNFEQSLDEALNRHLDASCPAHLKESMRYSLLAGGKRIRPRLVLECARMLSLPEEAALPAAIALEMVHCFTLIHDDLPCMDNDDFRRGKPSNHKVYGEATALLAGDGLMALASDSLLDAWAYVEADHLINAVRRLTWAMGPRGVIGGQAAESTLDDKSSLQDVQAVHASKTGALFSASLLIPKDLAGVSSDSDLGKAIHSFADGLGLAFQIVDDLEDELEVYPPSHILHFLSREDARKLALDQLRAGQAALSAQWGDAAEGLIAISEEVSTRLVRADQ